MTHKPTWIKKGKNRGEPIWIFKYLGHKGEVVKSCDDKYSAKLDNSGELYIESVDIAKNKVEQWLQSKIENRISTAKEWLQAYTPPTDTVTITKAEYDALVKDAEKYKQTKDILSRNDGLSITLEYKDRDEKYANKYHFTLMEAMANPYLEERIKSKSLELWKQIDQAIDSAKEK